jgi:hypothetical protein
VAARRRHPAAGAHDLEGAERRLRCKRLASLNIALEEGDMERLLGRHMAVVATRDAGVGDALVGSGNSSVGRDSARSGKRAGGDSLVGQAVCTVAVGRPG